MVKKKDSDRKNSLSKIGFQGSSDEGGRRVCFRMVFRGENRRKRGTEAREGGAEGKEKNAKGRGQEGDVLWKKEYDKNGKTYKEKEFSWKRAT